jgi:hypothetical protein
MAEPATETENAKTLRDIYHGEIKIKRPMETGTAIFQTSHTYFTSWMTLHGGRCEWFERQWLDCASQIGMRDAYNKCKDEDADLKECLLRRNTFKRYERMQEERQKRRVPYLNPPPIDTLNILRFKANVFD